MAILLEGGVDRLLLESGSLLLEEGASTGATQTLDTSFVSSTEQTFAPNVIQVVKPSAVGPTATTFAPTVVPISKLLPSIAGVFSTAVRFNDWTDRLKSTTVPSAYNSAYTVSMWYYYEANAAVGGTLWGMEDAAGGAGSYHMLFVDGAASTITIESNLGQVGTVALTDKCWHYIAMSVVPSGGFATASLYMARPTESLTAALNSGSVANGTPVATFIGGRDGGFNSFAQGRISRLRLWTRSLSAAELDTDRHSPEPASTTNLIGYWKLETTASILTASVGATLTNSGLTGVWTQDEGPPYGGAQAFASVVTNLNTLLPSFVAAGSTSFAPSVIQIVQPGLFGPSSSIFAPVVTQTGGATTLLPGLYGPDSVTFAPTLTNLNTLVPSLVGPGSTTFAPVVTNLNTLVPSLVGPTATTFAPSLTNLNTLLPSVVGPGSSAFAPSVVQVVTPPAVGPGSSAFAPSVIQVVLPGLFGPSSATFAPVVVQAAGPITLFPSLFGPSSTTFAPTLTNLNTLLPSLVGPGSTAFAPNLTNLNTLLPSLVGPTATTFAPTLTNLNTLLPSLVGPGSQTFAPSVIQVVSPPAVGPGSTAFAPTVTNLNTLVPSLVGPTATTFAPTLTNLNTLVPSLVGPGSTTFAPSIIQIVSPSLHGPTSVTFAPSLTNLNTLIVGFVPSGAQIFPPTVSSGALIPPLYGPDSVVFAPTLTSLNKLLPSLVGPGSATFAPSVVQIVSPPSVGPGSTAFAPTVVPGAVTVIPPLHGPTAVTFAPTVVAGASTLVSPFVASTAQTFAPSIVQLVKPSVHGPTSAAFAPTVTNLNTLLPSFVPSGSTVSAPSIVQVVSPGFTGSTAQTFAPVVSAGALIPPFIASGAQIFLPAISGANSIIALLYGPDSVAFAPSVKPIVTPPLYSSGVIYPPTVVPGVGWATQTQQLPLIKALELPLPTTVTKIVGIHQSDIVIRSAIEAGLADLRANPWLLDYVFASLPQDTLTWKEYGERDLQEAKKWFISTHIPVSVLPRFNESKWPQITIELLESSEVVPEAIIGDINYDPEETNDMSWPALTPTFTPTAYTPSTGIVTLAADSLAWLAPGMFLVDRQGVAHKIVTVTSQSVFAIDPGTVADMRGCVIKGHRPNWSVSVESSSFKESYRIGIHCDSDSVHLTWLHAILQFALLRYKQVLLEGRGFERSTISSTQIALDQRFEVENIFTRYITISGYVRQFWPKTVSQVIDGVVLDALSVSGQNADVSVVPAGIDPLTAAWVGNLDTIRRRK